MKAYVFPGQGSQKKGMGADLFDSYAELVRQADAILGYSIKDLCVNDPDDKLSQTQYTQPALFTVCCMMYLKAIEDSGTIPDFVAGHSIGEYAALYAAGVFNFETGLKIVQYRSQLMSEAKGGGMAAIVGLNSEQVQQLIQERGLASIDIANFNSVSQTVISGPKADIEAAQAAFETAGAAMYIVLKVSGAFHSRYMKAAGQKFESFLQQFTFQAPQIKVVANVDAGLYTMDNIKQNLAIQIVSSVQWLKTIKYLLTNEVADFKEVGPGNVLTGLINRIKTDR